MRQKWFKIIERILCLMAFTKCFIKKNLSRLLMISAANGMPSHIINWQVEQHYFCALSTEYTYVISFVDLTLTTSGGTADTHDSQGSDDKCRRKGKRPSKCWTFIKYIILLTSSIEVNLLCLVTELNKQFFTCEGYNLWYLQEMECQLLPWPTPWWDRVNTLAFSLQILN
jgi:hypothetical protein